MICSALAFRSSCGFNVTYMRPELSAVPPPPMNMAMLSTAGSACTMALSCS
jgi:hypothetical protein